MSDETPAIRRTDEAPRLAVTSVPRPGRPGAARPAAELLRGLAEPSAGRWGIARPAPCAASADEIAWHAVESCRRVAELAARR